MANICHLYTNGKNVLFRNDEDYCFMINRLALLSTIPGVSIWAYSVMSTHYHCVLEANDKETVKRCASKLDTFYTHHFSKKYNMQVSGLLSDFEYRELNTLPQIEIVLNYVLKNSVHHHVTRHPYEYLYSSVAFYYMEALNLLAAKMLPFLCQSVSETKKKVLEKLVGHHQLPDKFQVFAEQVILPSSFLNIEAVEAVYKNIWHFNVQMNSKPSDTDGQLLSRNAIDLTALKCSDLEVCNLFDGAALRYRLDNFSQLSATQSSETANLAFKVGADSEQIKRCLWMKK